MSNHKPRLTPVFSSPHRRMRAAPSSGRLPLVVLLVVVIALLLVWRYRRAHSAVSGGQVFSTQPGPSR